jgi:hypothetical protein
LTLTVATRLDRAHQHLDQMRESYQPFHPSSPAAQRYVLEQVLDDRLHVLHASDEWRRLRDGQMLEPEEFDALIRAMERDRRVYR